MSTQQIIDAWESGVEPYNATTDEDAREWDRIATIRSEMQVDENGKPLYCDEFPTS